MKLLQYIFNNLAPSVFILGMMILTNGLALSKDESFLLLSKTSKYRTLKYWLKGDRVGTSEIFMGILAGFPNKISRRDNGYFWIDFITKRNDQLDDIHPKKRMKKFVYCLPSFVQPKAE